MSSSSRAQSQSSRYSRKRSNTAQSAYRSNTSATPSPLAAPPPVKVGESKTLAAWVHDPEKSAAVIFNHNWWPGINEGDLLRVTLGNPDSGFLFFVPKEDTNSVKPQLQVRPFAPRRQTRGPFHATKFLTCSQDIYPGQYRRGIRHQEQRRNHGHQSMQPGIFGALSTQLSSILARQRIMQGGLCRVCIPGPISRPE